MKSTDYRLGAAMDEARMREADRHAAGGLEEPEYGLTKASEIGGQEDDDELSE